MLRESDGTAVAVDSAEIREAQKTMGSFGISSSPEGAAVWAGLLRLCDEKWIRPEDRVVLFNTSHAMKYWPWKMQGNPPVVRNYADFRSAAGDSG